ncbi:Chaperone of endosialidase [Lentzea albidocapillata subsp. violacea]|uniref:Chaperone of endosialidase n=1 Tax=Lentzea albidocapillata subsp. violacea TaxID=128104 RepID=A0A1G8V9P8_9PSEU|nr:tail fiber domain-containing protein [Lentzea albidocapillata]SDJ62587.1 Chaperone of endosialidase [Lentzea albidocapillata subsp. violacea]
MTDNRADIDLSATAERYQERMRRCVNLFVNELRNERLPNVKESKKKIDDIAEEAKKEGVRGIEKARQAAHNKIDAFTPEEGWSCSLAEWVRYTELLHEKHKNGLDRGDNAELTRLWHRCSGRNPSDRNLKEDIRAITGVTADSSAILEKVGTLPISTWRYRWEPNHIRHLGPMAQDWNATFGLGDGTTVIGCMDVNGVTLASIQVLHRQLGELRAEIAQLRSEVRRALPASHGSP